MSVYGADALLTVLATVALIPIAMLPILGTVVRRYGRLRGWPLLASLGLLGSAVSLAAFTVFPLPAPGTLDCEARSLLTYWQTRPFASIAPIADAFGEQGLAAVTSGVFLQVFFNILLFVPYGFFLHQVTRWRAWVVVGVGLATSLLIEVTQGTAFYGAYDCPYRLFDVDDLLINTTGGAVGVGLSVLLSRWWRGSRPEPVPDLEAPRRTRRVAASLVDAMLVLAGAVAVRSAIAAAFIAAAGLDRAVEVLEHTAVAITIDVLVGAALLLAVPLIRRDRATPGMLVLNIAPADAAHPERPAQRRAVMVRYAVRWLLYSVNGGLGIAIWTVELMVVLARKDRRSLAGLAARTVTRTRPALAADAGLTVPHDAAEPQEQD
ncbi:VanZ family protein [Demequina sp. SYSU T00068]|uniref:VanZ family protein n=1 Tax=Demequina lignilytica TaxID=3051663 RepID=UPI0026196852|nr:VanZ family protein [Demequina sp. SYSU T00068]MDN4491331.1 VanZ family protein [Demequina sp. SYSU T00068]